ncbi:MAG: molybdenum cofactor biosynthesis protein MoaE [Lacipirellulaceae bacterium]
MSGVAVTLVEGPLAIAKPTLAADGVGASLVFEGVVRRIENDRPLAALVYEAYEPMTTRELDRLAHAARQRFGLASIDVEHSVGRVAVGACSFRVAVSSAHRRESLDAVAWFVDEMKRTVPLWKVPAWA